MAAQAANIIKNTITIINCPDNVGMACTDPVITMAVNDAVDSILAAIPVRLHTGPLCPAHAPVHPVNVLPAPAVAVQVADPPGETGDGTQLATPPVPAVATTVYVSNANVATEL